MKDEPKAIQQVGEGADSSGTREAQQPETSSRRELIERYAKYAVVAAPLLLFVSKANAIHSKP
jgi:hypothetical protein